MQSLRATDSAFSVSSANLRPQKAALQAVESTAHEPVAFQTPDGRTFQVPGDGSAISFGRRSSNDVALEHPKVSRHHAEMRQQGGQLEVRDTGSSYGTYLNGAIIEPHRWVRVPAEAELMLGLGGPKLQLGEGHDLVQLRASTPSPEAKAPVVQKTAAPVLAAIPTVLTEEAPAQVPEMMPIGAMLESGMTRRTVGWSGDGPHQALIQRGIQAMDRIAPGYRQKLDSLLDQDHDPQTKFRLEQLLADQMKIYQDNGQLLSLPDALLEKRMGSGARDKRDQLEARIDAIQDEVGRIDEARLALNQVNNRKADDLCVAFLKQLRASNSEGINAGERVTIDDKALAQLAEKKISPDDLRAWVNDFYHQTGLPIPAQIPFKFMDDRPQYLNREGAVNVGTYFSKRLCLHELAHRVDHEHPEISAANKSWVEGRCRMAGEDPERPMKLSEVSSQYGEGEIALKDHFVNAYVGKVYPGAPTEVLTIGFEHFADPKHMKQLYQQDPEHFFMVLGALDLARR